MSCCRQGDVGMEGPRGGVGGPGETVRKHILNLPVVETFIISELNLVVKKHQCHFFLFSLLLIHLKKNVVVAAAQ